jgi:(1->4)-alpha-D-glucan 1-alpha-D-glucosylmutase
MNISDYDSFNRLCEASGIIESYYDIRGVHHVATLETKVSLLKAMRITIENDSDIHSELENIRRRDWQTIVAPVHVYQRSISNVCIALVLNKAQIEQPIVWRITEDNGEIHQGEWRFDIHHAAEQGDIEGKIHFKFLVPLPSVSNDGYHQLNLQLADAVSVNSQLIATPETCYLLESFEGNKKIWGIGLQLYSLRSKRNWGIGDFSDLNNVCKILAPLGVDMIGLNPLHTLFSHLPENASPYSPSSRKFLNPIYLDIESIEEFASSQKLQRQVNTPGFQNRLKSLRHLDLVNYSEIWSIKLEAFESLYQQFKLQLLDVESSRIKMFRQFQSEGGMELHQFSLFEALQAFYHQQNSDIKTWQQWPEAFHNPESDSVKIWSESNADRIEFQQYLQWQTELQLSDAQATCKQLGMQVGLYNDLAVGDEIYSSTCWAKQSKFALDVSVGAPPDDLSLLGQDWGLPPQLPQVLTDSAYQLFIDTLRANMRHAGALRIDHVMGLMRLYWVPEGDTADQGTYINYPFDDLLGILALESHRNQCLVVGEDLGTVPDQVRHKLWLKRILSYRVLFFEKNWHQGSYKHPNEYPLHALCSAGSHDLPTLKEYWNNNDLIRRETLDLFPSEEMKHQQWQARNDDRHAIKQTLFNEGLISKEVFDDNIESELTQALALSIQKYMARSQSLLMTVQLEDILSQENQINIPGTVKEYPNWRHKITIDIEDWRSRSELELFSKAITAERMS